jgi:hypothetical protein
VSWAAHLWRFVRSSDSFFSVTPLAAAAAAAGWSPCRSTVRHSDGGEGTADADERKKKKEKKRIKKRKRSHHFDYNTVSVQGAGVSPSNAVTQQREAAEPGQHRRIGSTFECQAGIW